MATNAYAYRHDQPFFLRMALAIAGIILIGFLQWSLRGFVDYGRIPIWVHLHALVMASWLALFVAQNYLAASGGMPLHRRLGWLGAGLIATIPPVGIFSAVKAIELHRFPPFFTPGYFLALSIVDVCLFAATACVAILARRDTQWHRRLMLVSTVLLMEPAFGRMLPMPLLGATGPWCEKALQLAILSIAVMHDRRESGQTHPALKWGAGLLVGSQLTITFLSTFAPFTSLAEGIAAG